MSTGLSIRKPSDIERYSDGAGESNAPRYKSQSRKDEERKARYNMGYKDTLPVYETKTKGSMKVVSPEESMAYRRYEEKMTAKKLPTGETY